MNLSPLNSLVFIIPNLSRASSDLYSRGSISSVDIPRRLSMSTAFSIENEYKDVNICMNLAKECGVSMPGEANALRVYQDAMDAGYGKEDFCATIKVVRNQK